MNALAPADRSRLVNILGMLGSDHDGERASAGLLASKMLRERGLSWADVIAGDAAHGATPLPRQSLWRSDLALARRHVSSCSIWEQRFVGSVAQRHTLSQKQQHVLGEIAMALRARGLS